MQLNEVAVMEKLGKLRISSLRGNLQIYLLVLYLKLKNFKAQITLLF